jgi:protein-S-isoprenylcysteine O-methyltransferase Ste14
MKNMSAQIPPPLLGVLTGVLMWWMNKHFPMLILLSIPWNRLGWLLIAAGIIVDAVSVVSLKRAGTTVNPLRIDKATALVVSGLYRISRNPMYLGLMTIMVGWALLLGSLGPLLVVVLFERPLVILQIQPEERALTMKFGDSYVSYAKRVKRWIGFHRS